MNPEITVIFPYYNESQTLERTLELISQQTHSPKEVIFVNSSSTDNSSALIDLWIEQHQELNATYYKNIFENTNTPSSSKNVGIRLAKTEWIAFMDCGLLFSEDWLESQVNFLNKSGLDIVSGVCELSGVNIIDDCCLAQTYGYKRKRPVVPSTLVRKIVFDKTGMFLENRRAGYDVAWRIYLKQAGIIRGVNLNAVIRYNGVSFADKFSALLAKMIKYLKPAVAIRHYHTPYFCVGIFLFWSASIFFSSMLAVGLIGFYVLARLLMIPIIKSRGILIFIEHPLAIFYMLPVGIVMDIGRLIGIFQGVYFYHLGGNRKFDE
ncbi:glycosyltransferase family 2 protein [bacterium]|nr:glycosyltransferase family 2 protein [bacterium]